MLATFASSYLIHSIRQRLAPAPLHAYITRPPQPMHMALDLFVIFEASMHPSLAASLLTEPVAVVRAPPASGLLCTNTYNLAHKDACRLGATKVLSCCLDQPEYAMLSDAVRAHSSPASSTLCAAGLVFSSILRLAPAPASGADHPHAGSQFLLPRRIIVHFEPGLALFR